MCRIEKSVSDFGVGSEYEMNRRVKELTWNFKIHVIARCRT